MISRTFWFWRNLYLFCDFITILVIQTLTSKNLMGAAVGAAFVVALTMCLLFIREKMDFGFLDFL